MASLQRNYKPLEEEYRFEHPIRYVAAGYRKAYSSLEIMVALAIISIIMAASMASIGWYDRKTPLDGTVGRLQSVFSMAQSTAIAQNTTVRVNFDLGRNVFWVDQEFADPKTPLTSSRRQITTPEFLGEHVEYSEVTVTPPISSTDANVVPVDFYADGRSHDTVIKLHLTGADSSEENYRTLKLYGATGRAQQLAASATP